MFHNQTIKEKLLRGGGWAFSGKFITALVALGSNALLARLLSPEELGAYFLTVSLVSVATITAQLGLTQTIIKLVAESMGAARPARARLAVRWAVRLTSVGALTVACGLAFGGGSWVANHIFHSKIMSPIMGLAAVWVIIISFQQLIAEIFRGFHDIRLATCFGGLVTGLLAMLMFLGLWLWQQDGGELYQVIIITLVAGFSSLALSSIILWNKLINLPASKGDAITGSEIIKISWPLWVTGLFLLVLGQVDLWIMGVFRSAEEVAIYGAVFRIVALITIPLMIVNAVAPPVIAEMYAAGETKKMESILRTVATYASIPSLIVLGAFALYGKSILGVFFGEYYRSGATILIILSVGQLVNVWAGSCGMVLIFTRYQSTMMLITALSGVCTAYLAWFLVEKYAGVGVAVSASLGMILQNLMMLIAAKRKVGVWTHMKMPAIKNIRLR
ncbi:MAG: oligosaccharide flippase family protein [Porticoccaceae bacterium]